MMNFINLALNWHSQSELQSPEEKGLNIKFQVYFIYIQELWEQCN